MIFQLQGVLEIFCISKDLLPGSAGGGFIFTSQVGMIFKAWNILGAIMNKKKQYLHYQFEKNKSQNLPLKVSNQL